MFKKLFGNTEKLQMEYLTWRSIVSIIAIIVTLIISLSSGLNVDDGKWNALTLGVVVPAMFLWGLGATKTLFGFATFGSLFSNHMIFGIIYFLLALFVSIFVGAFVELIGLLRWIYLVVKQIASFKTAK